MNQKTNRDHSFDVELAIIVGVEKAIILKNFDHWCRENARRHSDQYFHDGQYWTAESLKSLARKYPYMKRSSIARWVNELESDQWLIIGKKEREVNFYRPGLIFDLWNTGEDWEAEILRLSQNETDETCPKMRQGLSQNETGAVPLRDSSCPIVGQYNIDLDVDGNVDPNVESGDEKNNGVEDKKTPAAKTVRGAKKTGDYEARDVAVFLEIPQQVFYTNVMQNGSWPDYLEYRRTQHRFKYKDAKSHALAVKNLFTCTGGKPELAQSVVDQSRAKGWTGLFPVKDNSNGNGKQQHVQQQHDLAGFVLSNRKN